MKKKIVILKSNKALLNFKIKLFQPGAMLMLMANGDKTFLTDKK
jgi:hypothetical protein